MTENVIKINGTTVEPGERTKVKIGVGNLPSGTKIYIESHVFRAQAPGPCVLIVGGVHGDEINGIQIVRKALENRLFENLVCGGSSKGSLASRVARAMTKEILPNADYLIDFHTGGSFRYNHPQVRYTANDKEAEKLANAFAPPILLQKPLIPKSFRKMALEMGVPTLVYEGGEAVRIEGFTIDVGLSGMSRVLKSLKLLKNAPPAQFEPKHFKKSSWVRSPKAGLFIWTQHSGNSVVKGEPLGTIKDPQGEWSYKVLAPKSGYIVGHSNASVVHVGDALFHFAYND